MRHLVQPDVYARVVKDSERTLCCDRTCGELARAADGVLLTDDPTFSTCVAGGAQKELPW